MATADPKPPVGTGSTAAVGVIVALLVTLLGLVGVHDAVVGAGWLHGSQWIAFVVRKVSVLVPASWMWWVGIIAIVVGLWFVLASLRPRLKQHWLLGSGVWLGRADTARLAVDSALAVPGVISASSKANGRRVLVKASVSGGPAAPAGPAGPAPDAVNAVASPDGSPTPPTGQLDPGAVGQAVEQAVGQRLAILDRGPRVRVKVKQEVA